MSRLASLAEHGQSVWLDYIDRKLIDSGGLAALVRDDALAGVTSNPAIFQKAIAAGAEYADLLGELAPASSDAKSLYEAVAIRDIQDAADVLRRVYDGTDGRDGFVSLEVSPLLAHDTAGTVDEARRLWGAVDRPNLMVKVPGTLAGMPAIETLIGDGINVNVTLLFSRAMYERAAMAYVAGLEKRHQRGESIQRVASVASFFVSRIDTAVDARLRALGGDAPALGGRTAIANARLAYGLYEQLLATSRWQRLAAGGARPQRLLWASTSTKDPALRDVLYVETLIGPDTVNTLPPATLDAFRDHGEVAPTLADGRDAAHRHMAALAAHGIVLDEVTDQLLDDGITQFTDAFEALLATVEQARLAHA